jgi:inorganic pyrophosphatase
LVAIIDFGDAAQVTARHERFEHQRVTPKTRAEQTRREAGNTASNHHHIVLLQIIHRSKIKPPLSPIVHADTRRKARAGNAPPPAPCAPPLPAPPASTAGIACTVAFRYWYRHTLDALFHSIGEPLMDITKIPIGKAPPYDINVIVEIPKGGEPVKYELDKASGAMFVDRFLHTAMFYPGNYGFVPHTLSADGDPIDVIVVGQAPVVPGAVIRARPIGAIMMEDEAGPDEKVVAVPVDKLHPFYSGVRNYTDLPQILCDQIAHFFQHYKDLEKGKWVTIVNWVDAEGAARLVEAAIARAIQKDSE